MSICDEDQTASVSSLILQHTQQCLELLDLG